MKGLERRGSSCGPQPQLLNLDQLIYRRRIKAVRACYPSLLYIHEPAVCVGGTISHDNPGSALVSL